MLQALFRGIVRLLVGKDALENAQQISQAARQRRQLERSMKKHGATSEMSEERQALISEAKRTQAHVDATMDDETRKKVQETAARLMKEGK